MLTENDVRRYSLYLKILMDPKNEYPEWLTEKEIPRLQKILDTKK